MAIIKGGIRIGKGMSQSDKDKMRAHFPNFVAPKGEETKKDWNAIKPVQAEEKVPDFSKMKKDELNDYAARKGYEKEIKPSMKKKTMVEKLKGLFGLKSG